MLIASLLHRWRRGRSVRSASHLLLAFAALLGSSCERGDAAATTELRIAAAASLRELLAAADPAFTVRHAGSKLIVSFEASSTLSRQIEAGAGYDCFLSADAANVDRLGDRLVAATRSEFLGNELVVVVREGLLSVPSDAAGLLQLPGKLALAGAAVPAGKYARAWLLKAGQLAALEQTIVNGDDVRATLALVESGAADAAVVYRTDALIARSARLAFQVPKAEDPGVVYVAAALAGSRSPLAAEYVRWLLSDEFQRAAAELGFKTVSP